MKRIFLLIGCAFCLVAWAEPSSVVKEASGEAAIVDGDEIRATKDATQAALRNAVEQAAGLFISADTLTKNSQLVSDRVFANASGYIKKYDVIAKKKERGVVSVTVKAEVGLSQLDKDLAAVKGLIARLGNRKLMVVIQEQVKSPRSDVPTRTQVMSTVLTEAFREDGWKIIDMNASGGKIKVAAGAGAGAGEAIEGDLSDAEYVLYGNALYQQQEFRKDEPGSMLAGAPVFIVTGEYDLTLYAADSRQQIAKISGKFETFERDKNGKPVSVDPGRYVISYDRTTHDIVNRRKTEIIANTRGAIVERLRQMEVNGNTVEMTVAGLSDYKAVQSFKKALGQVNNVKSVTPGTFGSGKAKFDVLYVGTTDDLAGALGTTTFKKKKIQVIGVSGNRVELTVGK